MNKLTLICDMDEVLCDLSDYIRLRVNKDFNKNYPKGFNKKYWWADYPGIERNYFENILNEKGLFLNLKPIEGSIETLTKLHNEGFDIHILTCPQHNKYCYIEKVEWIQKYLPFINIETNFHTTGNKGMFAKENRVLIDDNVKYLQQFIDNGGMAITFNQGWNQDFEGWRAYNWADAYEITHSPRTFAELLRTIEPVYSVDIDKYRRYMEGEHNE